MSRLTRKNSRSAGPARWRRVLMLILASLLLVSLIAGFPSIQARVQAIESGVEARPPGEENQLAANSNGFQAASSPSSALNPGASATYTATPPPTATPTPTTAPLNNPAMQDLAINQGLIVVAMQEGLYSHLFVYQPQAPSWIRLGSGSYDDITPEFTPDGTHLAFASNRDGQWDLYLMDLANGEVQRLTKTPEYEASPTFSPDGRWMAYETLNDEQNSGLDIAIRALGSDDAPIQLTNSPGLDYAPAWAPNGRQIAFVSDRSGDSEIWLADLDRIDDRFQNLSQDSTGQERYPRWSPDGSQLAWATLTQDGMQAITVWRPATENQPASQRVVGSGSLPVWSPQGDILLTGLDTPNQVYLTGYNCQQDSLVLPPLALSGKLHGLAWSRRGDLRANLDTLFAATTAITPAPLWQPALTPLADVPNGRQRVVPLAGIQAPNPYLHDMVDEAFQALRQQVASSAGWDFLSNLENAYVPLTAPLDPGMSDDWLYTGRAFAFNSLPIHAGWLVVVREDYGALSYWRVFLRARFQDGSQGAPLHDQPWNFDARYSGEPRYYEQGGALAEVIPQGYWIDFTALAQAYGWQRLPALNTWRSSYPAARFNEFIMTNQLDWRSAMLELYPKEVLVTPTAIIPTTQVPSATLRPTGTPTPTRKPWPTWTPSPTSKNKP